MFIVTEYAALNGDVTSCPVNGKHCNGTDRLQRLNSLFARNLIMLLLQSLE